VMAPGKSSLPNINPPGKERTLPEGNLARRLNQAATSYHGYFPERLRYEQTPRTFHPVTVKCLPVGSRDILLVLQDF